jgi:hypothetical protein
LLISDARLFDLSKHLWVLFSLEKKKVRQAILSANIVAVYVFCPVLLTCSTFPWMKIIQGEMYEVFLFDNIEAPYVFSPTRLSHLTFSHAAKDMSPTLC